MSVPPPMPPLNSHYDVAVIGGGLAGCSVSTHLAKLGFSVLLAEQRRYPAHRLCGEFLSTEAGEMLDRLGVLGAVEGAGAHPIRRALLSSAGGKVMETALPGTALGLSRYRLDALLFEQARACGAHARDACAVTDVAMGADGHFQVEIPDGVVSARFVIGAYGKRSRLDGRLKRSFLQQPSPLVGFKAHFEGPELGDYIEMHAFDGGYCGLSHVENGMVNVCWLADARALKVGGGTPEGMIEHVLRANPHLARRLDGARRVSPRFEAVAQVHLRRKGLRDGGVCMVGDTAAMITPLCGDGMSMALRTAELVAPLVARHLSGELGRADFEKRYEQTWRCHFATRLQLGRLLHHAFVRPGASEVLVRAGRALPAAAAWLVRQTRG